MIQNQSTITTSNVAQRAFGELPTTVQNFTGQRYVTVSSDADNAGNLFYGVARPYQGFVSITTGLTALTGVGTLFTTELAVGDLIQVADQIFTIATIVNATSATVTVAAGSTIVSQPYTSWISTTYRSTRVDAGASSATFVCHRIKDVVVVSATAGTRFSIQASI